MAVVMTLKDTVILEPPPKKKSATVSTISPSICHEVTGPDAMISAQWSDVAKVPKESRLVPSSTLLQQLCNKLTYLAEFKNLRIQYLTRLSLQFVKNAVKSLWILFYFILFFYYKLVFYRKSTLIMCKNRKC